MSAPTLSSVQLKVINVDNIAPWENSRIKIGPITVDSIKFPNPTVHLHVDDLTSISSPLSLSASVLVGGVVYFESASTDFTVVLPTAASMITAMNADEIGDAVEIVLVNNTGKKATLTTTDASVTLLPSSSAQLASYVTSICKFVVSSIVSSTGWFFVSGSQPFLDTDFAIVDATDNTKKIKFDAGGSASTTTTITTAPTTSRNFKLPDLDGTSVIYQDNGFCFVNQTGQWNSNAMIQATCLANPVTAQSCQLRCNQFGNNANTPGATGFKSRSATPSTLVGVVDGDPLYTITAIGVAPDNTSIPLAGTIRIYVPTGGSVGTNNYVATDFDVGLVPLAGPINGKKQAFKVSSEGILHIKESANCMAGLATLNASGTQTVSNTRVTATSKIMLTIQDGGTVPTGFVYVSGRVASTSFSITSSAGAADNGVVVYYQIWEPTTP
jgi:hypothetical protein